MGSQANGNIFEDFLLCEALQVIYCKAIVGCRAQNLSQKEKKSIAGPDRIADRLWERSQRPYARLCLTPFSQIQWVIYFPIYPTRISQRVESFPTSDCISSLGFQKFFAIISIGIPQFLLVTLIKRDHCFDNQF